MSGSLLGFYITFMVAYEITSFSPFSLLWNILNNIGIAFVSFVFPTSS